MKVAKQSEYMDRAFNAEARPLLPPPYAALRVVDSAKQEVSVLMAQQYKSGVAEGWRQSWAWRARNTAVLIAFGVCVGVVLALVLLPMIGFIFGVKA